jgi:uncharacterized protein
MTASIGKPPVSRATAGYIVPFLIYVAMIALPLPPQVLFPVRFVLVLAAILVFSRPYLSWKPSQTLASIGVGIAVFVIWVGPDLLFGRLFGQSYRHSWLFFGGPSTSLSPQNEHNSFFLAIRVLSSVCLVPVLEELFWRGWLMRWFINQEFLKVPLGTYQVGAFWLVAVLFASEHGPYWDVGLLTGIIYNWWIVRTKNLADCILMHAVTNGALAAYVLAAGQWQYWL